MKSLSHQNHSYRGYSRGSGLSYLGHDTYVTLQPLRATQKKDEIQQLTFIMPSSVFQVIDHSINAQHIREYPAATAGRQEDVLQLVIKQYVPLSNPNPKPGDLSIIGAHANGFPKELYEPFWEEIYHRSKTKGIAIRGIWIADVAHQGQSGVVNECKLGNDRTNKHLPSFMKSSADGFF